MEWVAIPYETAFDARPPGPWDGEPNAFKVPFGDIPLIGRRSRLGMWCGYIGLTSPTEDEDSLPDVHGGWTLLASFADLDALSGLRMPWWAGFDCGHWCDVAPAMAAMPWTFSITSGTYKTVEFVARELHRVAQELAR